VKNGLKPAALLAALVATCAFACAKTGGPAVKTNEKPTPTTTAPPAAVPGEGVALPAFDATEPVALLPPRLEWGPPLMTALARRHSSRSFSPAPLDLRLVSDLLWAAAGVNRPKTGGRTAPTARNRQDLDVYAVTADGAYVYDAKGHSLAPIAAGDLRATAGVQEFVAAAPLNLVYVSDLAKIAGETREDKLVFAGAHAGFASQNVYLFCAAAGLATVVRAWVDKPALAAALRLRPDQLVVLAQTVGRPGPPEPGDAD
jgi:SagB-type dehydrogenase family enzyme